MQKNKALRILAALKKAYPRAGCALKRSNPLELLVATILSAQCTDKRVNLVTPALFKKYKKAADYAKAPAATLEREIRSTGFYRNKAGNIIGAAKMIAGDFNGNVPDSMEKLIKLPGVARKTANIVLSHGFGKIEGIAVDTHVLRLSGRLGLSEHDDAVNVEKDLMRLFPRKDWPRSSDLLIAHGRAVCSARSPDCAACAVGRLCPSRKIFHPEI
jgi:endonuclease-3